jgi:hypothetical protein
LIVARSGRRHIPGITRSGEEIVSEDNRIKADPSPLRGESTFCRRKRESDYLHSDSLTYLRRDSAGSRRRQCGDPILPGLERFSRERSSGESDGLGGRTIKRGARRCNERRVQQDAPIPIQDCAYPSIRVTRRLVARRDNPGFSVSDKAASGRIFRIVNLNFREFLFHALG